MRRMRRLLLVSTAVMGVGFLAVLLAIAWRLVNRNEPQVTAGTVGERVVRVPAGAIVRSAVATEDRLTVTIERGGATEILVYSVDGDRLGRYAVVPEAQ